MTYYPFDTQLCELKFASWTMDMEQVWSEIKLVKLMFRWIFPLEMATCKSRSVHIHRLVIFFYSVKTLFASITYTKVFYFPVEKVCLSWKSSGQPATRWTSPAVVRRAERHSQMSRKNYYVYSKSIGNNVKSNTEENWTPLVFSKCLYFEGITC